MKVPCQRCKKKIVQQKQYQGEIEYAPISPAKLTPGEPGFAHRIKCPHCGLVNFFLLGSL